MKLLKKIRRLKVVNRDDCKRILKKIDRAWVHEGTEVEVAKTILSRYELVDEANKLVYIDYHMYELALADLDEMLKWNKLLMDHLNELEEILAR